MLEPSANTPWFKGWKFIHKGGNASGTMLLEAVDCILPPTHPTDKPLSAPPGHPQNWCYSLSLGAKWSLVFSEPGILKPSHGDDLCFIQCYNWSKDGWKHHEALSEALSGNNEGFKVNNGSVQNVCHGTVACDSKNDPHQWNPDSLTAQVIILNYPGQISTGYAPVLDGNTAYTPHKFAKWKEIDGCSEKKIEGHKSLKSGDAAITNMVPGKRIYVENFSIVFWAILLFLTRDRWLLWVSS